MNVCGDKGDRRWPVVFHPMRPRAEFSERLTGPKFLCCPVVVVISESPAEDVYDRRVAPVAVEPDMAAGAMTARLTRSSRFSTLSISLARSMLASTDSVTPL
jgi:hypothetical protein